MADTNESSSQQISLNMVKELMKVQEDNFKTFVNTLIVNFSSRLDTLTRDVQ